MKKEKIILIVAIVLAILLFSLGGYGYIKHNENPIKDTKSQDTDKADNQVDEDIDKPEDSDDIDIPEVITPPDKEDTTNKWQAYAGAWLELGNTSSIKEYSDGRVLDVLCPNYFDLNSSGVLVELTVIEEGVNAYTAANAADIKAHSRHQYITISGNYVKNIRALVSDPTKITNFKNTTKAMLDKTGFTGLDIDFEDFWEWSDTDYTNFKNFLTNLGTFLHSYGYKLQVDIPAFISAEDEADTPLRYADFDTLPVDRITIMAYDNDMALGVGHAIAPFEWIKTTIDYLKPQITDDRRIVMGIPSYGYKGPTGGGENEITNITKVEALAQPKASTAIRDLKSGEMTWTNNGTTYFYNDTYSMNAKRKVIEAKGITNVMVWVLGDDDWFTGYEPS